MTNDPDKSPPLTWFEKQYGEIAEQDIEELKFWVVRQAVSLFDELNFAGTLEFVDGPVAQDEDFSIWTASAHKEFVQLMAYCRALTKLYDVENDAIAKARGQA